MPKAANIPTTTRRMALVGGTALVAGAAPAPLMDAELILMADLAVDLEDELNASASWAGEEAFDQMLDRQNEAIERLAAMAATSCRGMRAKAEVLRFVFARNHVEPLYMDEALMLSLIKDAAALKA